MLYARVFSFGCWQLLSGNLEHALKKVDEGYHVQIKLELKDHVFVHFKDLIARVGSVTNLFAKNF